MFNIPLRVRNLIKKHGTSDLFLIASYLKITVIYRKTPNLINGFWKRVLKRKYIAINENLSEGWQIKAVIAHEIAHILLHPGYKSFCMAGRTFYANTRKEDEADQLAAELLSYSYDMDKSHILSFLKDGWNQPKSR